MQILRLLESSLRHPDMDEDSCLDINTLLRLNHHVLQRLTAFNVAKPRLLECREVRIDPRGSKVGRASGSNIRT